MALAGTTRSRRLRVPKDLRISAVTCIRRRGNTDEARRALYQGERTSTPLGHMRGARR